jgi:3-oxoacyl-[acyl-carrier protein] reductase
VSPGFIETDITSGLPQNVKERYLEAIPLGRFGNPQDVAKIVAFLASDDASYITGEVVRVNGGLYT